MFCKRIIIGGPPRSGSTLLRFILDRSTTILSGAETSFFLFPLQEQRNGRLERTTKRVADKLALDPQVILAAICDGQNSMQAFDRIMDEYRSAVQVEKAVWAEKTPRNCLHYERLAAEDSGLYFLSTVRHGLDIVTSKIDGHPRRNGEYWCSIDRYVESMQAVYEFKHARHLIVKYEDIVQQPVETVQGIFRFLGEPYSDEVIEDFQSSSPTRDFGKVHQPKLQAGLSAAWVDRWRHSEHAAQVAHFHRHPAAMQWLRTSGYVEGAGE